MGKRGGAVGSVAAPFSRRRRYSSRAAVWSSGKPSKPRAWAKRTTVELEVLARRASSSAVWNATSSRWSTMYCPTSFWERENSSNRWRISSDRVRAAVPERVTRQDFAGFAGVPARRGYHGPREGDRHLSSQGRPRRDAQGRRDHGRGHRRRGAHRRGGGRRGGDGARARAGRHPPGRRRCPHGGSIEDRRDPGGRVHSGDGQGAHWALRRGPGAGGPRGGLH